MRLIPWLVSRVEPEDDPELIFVERDDCLVDIFVQHDGDAEVISVGVFYPAVLDRLRELRDERLLKETMPQSG